MAAAVASEAMPCESGPAALADAACVADNGLGSPASGSKTHKIQKKNQRFPDAVEFNLHKSGCIDPEDDDPNRSCPGCDDINCEHSFACTFIGTSGRLRFGYAETFEFEVPEDTTMRPTPLGRARVFNFGPNVI